MGDVRIVRAAGAPTAVAAACAVLFACGDDVAEPLQDQRERWEAAAPDDYVVQTCTHGREPPGCVRARIADGSPVEWQERIFAGGSGWESYVRDDMRGPIDDMFDRASDPGECTLARTEYDPMYGFLSDYELDCGGEIVSGGYVICFEPEAADLEACDLTP